ncbi:MAG: hypothetical protein JWP97_775 [Labilithrix sp.]|nr:hypothetical protein [Labilithrix sp.]
MRALGPLSLLVLVTLVVVGSACRGNPQVAFEITVPSDLVAETVWFEIGAYKDAKCAGVRPMLFNGVPSTATTRVAFRREDPKAPAIGDLDRGTYAFAAVAKGDDCRVLATGCTEVDVDASDSVSIAMTANDPPTGACATGSACQAATCVPADDNQDPSVGAGCSLELLGAGPLANPVGGSGTMVSAPSVAATPTGFVIAYREIDPNATEARITVLPIDPAGGALDPQSALLKGRCADSDETDGVGLLTNGTAGQVVLARSACAALPGLELLSFTSSPEVVINPAFTTSDFASSKKLLLGNGHVAAANGGAGIVAFVDDGVARVSTVAAGKGVVAPTGTFGGLAGMTGAWATSSDRVLALLAAGPPSAVVTDAGADSGIDGGAEEPPPNASGPQLSLVMVPVGTSADQFNAATRAPRPPITFSGAWGAVAALGSRVVVLSDGNGPGQSVSYRTFELDRASTVDSSGFSVDGAGTVTTGDVAMLDDRAFFAVLKPGGVSLHAFANVSTTPRPLREVTFANEPRIPSVTTVRETGRVAVAATSSRVAVVWTTAKTLTNNDSTGGYAVFACTP